MEGSGDDMEEFLKPIKAQAWNRWFNDRIPMLNDMTPYEASETYEGRTLLDKLLAFYDQMGARSAGSGGVGMSVPTKYAKWKLGYGAGSAEEFAAEEEILNYQNSSQRLTQRKKRHTKILEKKKAAIFIPQRCEVFGCNKRGEDVKGCANCRCAYYCGKEHQTQDWPRHKLDCKTILSLDLDLKPKAFLTSSEIEKFPLNCFPIKNVEAESKCFICHSKVKEVDLTYTECCNLPICNNSQEYELMSYSRDFCHRNHALYTSCHTHHEEEHEGDWRDCDECNQLKNGARPFLTTNGFNITPCLERYIPQESMLTFPCDTPGCKSRMMPGHSASTFSGGKNLCILCSPHT